MTIEQIWKALEENKKVCWGNSSYKVVVEPVSSVNGEPREFQVNHHTYKNGKVLSIRCISNWFGGLMEESEAVECYIKQE